MPSFGLGYELIKELGKEAILLVLVLLRRYNYNGNLRLALLVCSLDLKVSAMVYNVHSPASILQFDCIHFAMAVQVSGRNDSG